MASPQQLLLPSVELRRTGIAFFLNCRRFLENLIPIFAGHIPYFHICVPIFGSVQLMIGACFKSSEVETKVPEFSWSWPRIKSSLKSAQDCPSTAQVPKHRFSTRFQPTFSLWGQYPGTPAACPEARRENDQENHYCKKKKRINRWVNRQKRLRVVNRWNGLNHPCATMENLVSDRWCSGEIAHLGGQGLTRATLLCL